MNNEQTTTDKKDQTTNNKQIANEQQTNNKINNKQQTINKKQHTTNNHQQKATNLQQRWESTMNPFSVCLFADPAPIGHLKIVRKYKNTVSMEQQTHQTNSIFFWCRSTELKLFEHKVKKGNAIKQECTALKQKQLSLWFFLLEAAWVDRGTPAEQSCFFFLQCRTSTRHGRSTTGNCKDCFENLPGIETQDKNNTHTTKQTQKQTTPTQKPRDSQAKQPGRFVN